MEIRSKIVSKFYPAGPPAPAVCHCQCLDLVQMKAILTVLLLTRLPGPVTSNKCTQVHAVSQTLRGPKLCTEYSSLSPSELLSQSLMFSLSSLFFHPTQIFILFILQTTHQLTFNIRPFEPKCNQNSSLNLMSVLY